jgi:hypothetical protein
MGFLLPDETWDDFGTSSTFVKKLYADGIVQAVDGRFYIYGVVPNARILDAKTDNQTLSAASYLHDAVQGLSDLANPSITKRRRSSKISYRSFHILTVNIPVRYKSTNHRFEKLYRWQESNYENQIVYERITLFGTQLYRSIAAGEKHESLLDALRDNVERLGQILVSNEVLRTEVERDANIIKSIFRSAGLLTPTAEQMRQVEGWWALGQEPAAPALNCPEHLHMCATNKAAREIQKLIKDDTFDCAKSNIAGSYPITFATVGKFDMGVMDVLNDRMLWGVDLINSRARAISIKGFVEPPTVTRKELNNNAKKYREDINERYKNGKIDKASQTEMLATLEDTEAAYDLQSQPATLIDTSIVVGFDGIIEDPLQFLKGSLVELRAMSNRQHLAWQDCQIGSPVVSSVLRHDLPTQTVAYAGLNNLSYIESKEGALLGFTELDRQPVYIYPREAQEDNRLPILLVAGNTGSGKSMILNFLATQFSKMTTSSQEMTPVVLIDYKQDSDFSEGVLSQGGQVKSLDDISSSDGVLDPIKCIRDKGIASEFAAQMLMSLWSLTDDNKASDTIMKSINISGALKYGVEHGATCTGQALIMALQASQLDNVDFTVDNDFITEILTLRNNNKKFRLICGTDANSKPLSISDGMTLLKSGKTTINTLPDGSLNLSQRVDQWVMRMSVFGVFNALIGRDGVVFLDEAWMFLKGKDTAQMIDEIARLARSQRVFFVMASQKMQEFVDANLMGAVSKGIILPLDNVPKYKGEHKLPGEADLALSLFEYETKDKVLPRITAGQTREGSKEPNPRSLYALRDPNTREVLRGSVPLYFDASGGVVPCEVVLPPNYLKLISTSSLDVDARTRANRRKQK